jgi:hypothetical protein
VGLRAVLDAVVKRKIPSPRRESNPRTPIVQPVSQRYTDWVRSLITFGNETSGRRINTTSELCISLVHFLERMRQHLPCYHVVLIQIFRPCIILDVCYSACQWKETSSAICRHFKPTQFTLPWKYKTNERRPAESLSKEQVTLEVETKFVDSIVLEGWQQFSLVNVSKMHGHGECEIFASSFKILYIGQTRTNIANVNRFISYPWYIIVWPRNRFLRISTQRKINMSEALLTTKQLPNYLKAKNPCAWPNCTHRLTSCIILNVLTYSGINRRRNSLPCS